REVRDPLALDDGYGIARLVRREVSLRDGAVLGELRRAQILRPGVGDVRRQAVPALGELRHLVLVTAGAHRRAGLRQHMCALVSHGARIVALHLVAVLAAYAGRGHRAVAVLLDDARR